MKQIGKTPRLQSCRKIGFQAKQDIVLPVTLRRKAYVSLLDKITIMLLNNVLLILAGRWIRV